ncbi:MAG: 6-pyruvoyltetrahydropterin/6-carboxytetrahydropterin synthase [Actinomycetota bacterium]|jgi:6-pyruvoyltetrahydropterin/6-carboxytetrahydropterin synthase|nr:6-pyruvoyltetrahydropterin/6-carboxytetrahydropterin synthase [Actinomycetota bacterium]
MQTSVVRTFRFEAAHQLPWHTGKCRQLHGHGYRLEVTVTGPLTGVGIVIDFADLAAVVRSSILDVYDHTFLNDLIENPTAEVIVADAWKRLAAAGLAVTRLRLWETEDCFVEITA